MKKLRFREVQSSVKSPTGTGTQLEVYLEPKLAPVLPAMLSSQGVGELFVIGAEPRTCSKGITEETWDDLPAQDRRSLGVPSLSVYRGPCSGLRDNTQ